MSSKKAKSNGKKPRKLTLEESASIESLQKIDDELRAVLSSLTPSLEALAELAPDDQVGSFKSLLFELNSKANTLSDENAKIKELIERFSGNCASPLEGLEEASYASFLYENKILGERLKRVLDPNCNKMIQCGIVDENLCKETQTVSLSEVLAGYLKEKDAQRQRDLADAKIIEVGKFKPSDVEERECGCEIEKDPLAEPFIVRIMITIMLVCLGFAFATTATLAALSLFYT